MESQKRLMVVFGLVAAVVLQNVAAQTEHVVGGSTGWNIPQSGDAQEYVTWASGQKFVIGDVLIFNFATNTHDVVEVPKNSFDSCSSDNSISNPINTGPAKVTLTSAGNHYYICSFGSHCQSGQKLAITVEASATSPGASPSAPTPGTTPPPTTTSPPTTPSPTSDVPCPPVQAPSPSTTSSGPTASPPSATSSSSPSVSTGSVMCLMPLLLGLLF